MKSKLCIGLGYCTTYIIVWLMPKYAQLSSVEYGSANVEYFDQISKE